MVKRNIKHFLRRFDSNKTLYDEKIEVFFLKNVYHTILTNRNLINGLFDGDTKHFFNFFDYIGFLLSLQNNKNNRL